jgi:transcription antitermination factor NusG
MRLYTGRAEGVPGQVVVPFQELPLQPQWYAAYTCANHERRVADQLARRDIEHFQPQYQATRRWNRRRVLLDLPLFPGYVFVRIPWSERLRVLEIPSVVYLVTFGGVPAPLDDGEMERLRECLAFAGEARPHPFLQAGRQVRLCEGPFQGLTGVLQRRKGSSRLVVSIPVSQRSISIEVDTTALEPA